MPDMRLTSWQACRLWDLTPSLCDQLLGALVAVRFLRRTADGVYSRRGLGWRSLRATGPDWLPREPDADQGNIDVDEIRRESPSADEPPDPEDDVEFLSLGV